jgi:hypothetical protein
MTAYGIKIKTGFAFFDEVFHQPSLAVKFDKICQFIRGIILEITGNNHIYHLEQVFWIRMISE